MTRHRGARLHAPAPLLSPHSALLVRVVCIYLPCALGRSVSRGWPSRSGLVPGSMHSAAAREPTTMSAPAVSFDAETKVQETADDAAVSKL